jgi:hypothetical protein
MERVKFPHAKWYSVVQLVQKFSVMTGFQFIKIRSSRADLNVYRRKDSPGIILANGETILPAHSCSHLLSGLAIHYEA